MDSLVRSGILLANNLTTSLQVQVTWSKRLTTTFGGENYGTPSYPYAIWEDTGKMIQGPGGQLVLQKSMVTFLQPLDIEYSDKIVGPNGQTGPIVNITGLLDPKTGERYMVEVSLGQGSK